MSGRSSPLSGAATPQIDSATGYLLLTIQHAIVRQLFDGDTMVLARGEMRLECVSLPISPEVGKQTANPFSPSPADPPVPTHDFWLVLQVGSTFEMPIMPASEMRPTDTPASSSRGTGSSGDGISYAFPSPQTPDASLLLTLSRPANAADFEDLDSFETLLRQYGSLGKDASALAGVTQPTLNGSSPEYTRSPKSPEPLPEEMRGRLVLINEDSGEVVGEIDQQLDVEADRKIAEGYKNMPVMIDFGDVVEGHAPRIKVQTVPEDEMDDWLLRGAHNISRGLLSFSSWSQRKLNAGTEDYLRKTTPRAEPVKFSPATKAGIRKTHNASVKTVNVTKTTVGIINNALSKVVEKGYAKAAPHIETLNEARRQSMSSGSSRPSPINTTFGTPPPLLPRSSISSSSPPPISPISTLSRRPPPIAPKPANLAGASPKIQLPSQTDQMLAEEKMNELHLNPPNYSELPSSPDAGPSSAARKRGNWSRLFLAGEVVLSSLEATTHDLINTGTVAASTRAGHKYGAEAGHATALVGGSVRNVALVYVDVRGVGRAALLKSTAKGFVKARLKDGEEVTLRGEDAGRVAAGEIDEIDGEKVVGIAEIGKTKVE